MLLASAGSERTPSVLILSRSNTSSSRYTRVIYHIDPCLGEEVTNQEIFNGAMTEYERVCVVGIYTEGRVRHLWVGEVKKMEDQAPGAYRTLNEFLAFLRTTYCDPDAEWQRREEYQSRKQEKSAQEFLRSSLPSPSSWKRFLAILTSLSHQGWPEGSRQARSCGQPS